MALHTDLPIYKAGVDLLSLAVRVQQQMPRDVKRSLGDRISQHCMAMLDSMALANATQRGERSSNINQVLVHQRALTVLLRVSLDSRYVSRRLWSESVQLLDSIGRQAGGWLKHSRPHAPAA